MLPSWALFEDGYLSGAAAVMLPVQRPVQAPARRGPFFVYLNIPYSYDDFPLSQLDCFITDLMQEKTNCLAKEGRQIIVQLLTGYFFSL